MLSKFNVLIALAALNLCACGGTGAGLENQDTDVIGVPLQATTQLSRQDGADQSKVSIFDETTRRIHQFDLSGFAFQRSFAVQHPDQKHYLLYGDSADYVVDLSEKHFSIFDSNGVENRRPVKLIGNPLSAAFRSDKNLLIVYDDVYNVGMIKLGNDGSVRKSWTGGSLISGEASIRSGDLLADGRLVLALSDLNLAIVDVDQSIDQQTWSKTIVPSNLSKQISWVAPVPDSNDQVLVLTVDEIALISLSTHTVLDSYAVSGMTVEKYSKTKDAHVILRSVTDGGMSMKMVYAQGSRIKSRALPKQDRGLIHSYLDISRDEWTYVEARVGSRFLLGYNDLDQARDERKMKKYRLSDMAGLENKALPDRAQLHLSSSYVFALFPSELGYAVRYSTQSDDVKIVKFFNRKYL